MYLVAICEGSRLRNALHVSREAIGKPPKFQAAFHDLRVTWASLTATDKLGFYRSGRIEYDTLQNFIMDTFRSHKGDV